MPPIKQLDEAFLSVLLDTDKSDSILNTSVDSTTLAQVLNHLNITYAHLQTELFHHVQKNHDLFVSSFESLNRLTNDTPCLEKQANNNALEVHDRTQALLSTYEQAKARSQLSRDKIQALEDIVKSLEMLRDSETHLKESRFVEAVDTFLNVQSDPRLADHIDEVRERILAELSEALHSRMVFDHGSLKVGEVAPVLASLSKLGQWTKEMTSIKRQTFKYLIDPLFDEPSRYSVKHRTDWEFLTLQEEDNPLNSVGLIKQVSTLLRFLLDYVVGNNERALFGHLFLPDLMQIMMTRGIPIPTKREELDDFDQVKSAVAEFEKVCVGLDLSENRLRDFVDSIDHHYAKQRRETILKEGRKVMLRRLYESEPTRVEEEMYQITQTPQLVSILINDTLHESGLLHPVPATQLVEAVRDVLDMYRALMPSYHRPQLLPHPASALVFRNDCFWLAHQLLWTSKKYPKIQLDESRRRLEELGNAWQELCMIQRVDTIQSVLDALCGFSTSQSTWDTTLSRAIMLVHNFADEIKPVVDPKLSMDIIGRIVDSVLNRLMGDLQDLTDIGADESHVIALTLNSVAQIVGAFDRPGLPATDLSVAGWVPTWDKFWLLKDILEMNMREIMESFRRGELHMFQKSELENLLCALFADSELRMNNLEEIRSGQPPVSLLSRSATVKASKPTPTSVEITPAPVSKLAYHPDEEEIEGQDGWDNDDLDLQTEDKPMDETEGWDNDELDLAMDETKDEKPKYTKEGWDNEKVELPLLKTEKTIVNNLNEGWDNDEGWDDEDLFENEK